MSEKKLTGPEKMMAIQREMGAVTKDGKGNYGKYATIGACMEKLAPLLEKHKLALYSGGTYDNEVRTEVLDLEVTERDENGEIDNLVASSTLPLSYAKGNTPHDLGSAITYFRRYNLYMLFNIMVEDDDGQSAQDGKKKASVTDDDDIF